MVYRRAQRNCRRKNDAKNLPCINRSKKNFFPSGFRVWCWYCNSDIESVAAVNFQTHSHVLQILFTAIRESRYASVFFPAIHSSQTPLHRSSSSRYIVIILGLIACNFIWILYVFRSEALHDKKKKQKKNWDCCVCMYALNRMLINVFHSFVSYCVCNLNKETAEHINSEIIHNILTMCTTISSILQINWSPIR